MKGNINNKSIIDNVDLKNYAFDVYNYDTGYLSGLEKYIEWLEELVLNPTKLKEVLEDIDSRKQ